MLPPISKTQNGLTPYSTLFFIYSFDYVCTHICSVYNDVCFINVCVWIKVVNDVTVGALLDYSSYIDETLNDTQQIFCDLSDTFSVRKMQLLGGQKPPQGTWASLWLAKRSWCGLGPPKSCIFITENVSDKLAKTCCVPWLPYRYQGGTIMTNPVPLPLRYFLQQIMLVSRFEL